MKIGLIGYGAWGSHHAAAIAECPDLELAGVCAQSEESRAAAAEKHRVPVFASYADMLPRVDAVDIVLPPHLHHAAAAAALKAGKHVLLEKPMTLSRGDCEDLISLARFANRTLYVGHELRHSTQWGRIRELIEEGAVGQPQYATVDLWRRPYRQGSGNWRYDPKRVGSWVLEEPIHFFDLVCWWMKAGMPYAVYARGSRRPSTPQGLWDNLTATLSFNDGSHATITQTLAVCEHHLSAKVVGDRGAIVSFWDGEMDRAEHPSYSLRLVREGHVKELAMAPSGELFELRAQLAHFAAVCRGHSKPLITPEEAAWAVRICLAAERSIMLNRPEAI